jgi:hypothetical protein
MTKGKLEGDDGGKDGTNMVAPVQCNRKSEFVN